MAASELNNRLDYLISYSSQLVFVCSDKIQQQSQVIESFLAHKNEQTDVALITANELTPLVVYREKLFRQLVNQTQEADFNLPLNQLLAPLNNHSGSILINIFQAEKLPSKLVKELWDLVLQSRFASNKQHLNVLLMGLSNWAETAKAGLGAKSKEQPIVLNNQIDIQHVDSQNFSDLESYIQDKRKKFAQRIEGRHEQSYVSQPIYKKWWVATLFSLIFVTVFIGMLGWQYPDKVSASFTYISTHLLPQEQVTATSEVVEPVELPVVEKTILASQPIKDTLISNNLPSVTPSILVTDWNTASAKIEKRSKNILLKKTNADKPIDAPKVHKVEPEKSIQDKVLATQSSRVTDYQIEDKVELIPFVDPTDVEFSISTQDLNNNVVSSESDMLMALPDDSFVIQIAGMANMDMLEDYIRDEKIEQKLWLYKTQRYGAQWYVLLKNQHFPSIENAREEIINLAAAMQKNTPFVKSIKQVKQEIRLSRL